MNKQLQATAVVASLYSFRMLGLFMLLPVFSIYARELAHTTPFLVGIALGIYGLTQACFQIPFGMLSDKIGRKPVITAGLVLFAAASVLGAISHSIWGIIIARALQGMGAIGSSLLALLADTTEDTYRTKAMAVIGIVIGMSFGASMFIAPIVSAHFGVPGIFWFTALLASLGIAFLHLFMPAAIQTPSSSRPKPSRKMLREVLLNLDLLRLNGGILLQHALLTAMFTVLPLTLLQNAGMQSQEHWHLYLPVMLMSFLSMVPMIIYAEKCNKIKPVFLCAIALAALGQGMLGCLSGSIWTIACALYLYFTGFNILEAMLPSLISRAAPGESRGTAMGVYSTAQFFGIFVGGGTAGLLSSFHHASTLYYVGSSAAIIWFLLSLSMPTPNTSRNNQVASSEDMQPETNC